MAGARAMALVAMLAVASASAAPCADLEYYAGSDLALECAAKPGDVDYAVRHGRCEGYVIGVSDAQQAAQGAAPTGRICLPPATTPQQLVTAVNSYLAAHPEKQGLSAHDLVLDSLQVQFPCK